MMKRFKKISILLNCLVLVIGCIVLMGWMFDIEVLKRCLPDTVAMNPATAVLFIFSSFSLFLLSSKKHFFKKQLVGNIFAIIILFAGAIKISQIIFGFDVQFDHFLFSKKLNSGLAERLANRMAPDTAFCFILLGTALLLLPFLNSKKRRAAHILVLITAFIALLSLLGYVYHTQAVLTRYVHYMPMAIYTALAFLSISLAVLFTYPQTGIMKAFTSHLSGSITARKFLPVAIFAPIVVGFLRVYLTDSGVIPDELATAILIVVSIAVFFVYVYYRTVSLNKTDNEQVMAQELLQSIVDNAPSFIYIKDLEGKYILVNESYTKAFGIDKNDLIGKTAFDLPNYNYSSKLLQDEKDLIRNIKNIESEEDIMIDGVLHQLFSVKFPLINKKGKVYATGAFYSDITEIKKQSHLVKDLYDNTPVGYYSLDEDGNFISVNNTTLTWLKYSKEELMGTSITALLTSEGKEKFKNLFPLFKKNGYVKNLEMIFCRKDGTLFPVLINASAVKNKQGVFLYSRSSILDITKRKEAEKKVDNSERRLKSFFENAPDAVIVIDEKERILEWNPKAETIFGYTENEVSGKMLSNTIIPVQYRQAHKKGMAHFLETGEGPVLNKTLEITALHKNGHEFYINLSISTLQIEGQWLFISFISDITQRRNLEDTIRKKEQQFRIIVETAQEGIWTFDENSIINFANKKMGQILGYSVKEMLGKKIFDFMDKEGITIAKENLESLKNQTKEMHDFKYITNTGKPIWANVANNAIFAVDHQYKGATSLVTDITERKKTDQQLKDLNKELDSFTYSVSHDLRAPLRIINGYAEIIINENKDALGEDAKRMLDNIMLNARRMGTLIDDLLNFSRLGRRDLITHLVNMNLLVEEIVEEQMKLYTVFKHNIKIHPLPYCICDSNLTKQVWQNLISNAFKYSSKNENPLIEIGSIIKENESVYFIQDNGVGFDMRYYDKLFGVFQRLHKESEFEGTGVGLALTQRIIQKQGGQIWAESEPNEETTFYFTLCV